MNSSEFFGFVSTRSSVRSYTGQDLTPEEVEFIMDCASTAPSAGNMQAWDVVLVTDEQQKERLSAAALEQPHVRAAAALLVVTANYVRSMSRYGERGILYAIQDATIACTYMMLAAHARGLVTCWVGAFDEEEVKKLLRIPVHVRPVAILCVGKGIPPSVRTARMPLSEHIHEDRW